MDSDVDPETTIDHLLSEEDRQKWEQESREFEAVGRNLFLSEASLYPIFYGMVCEWMASAVDPEVIRGEMSKFHEQRGSIRHRLSGGV